jgi:hypothetical protein
VAQTGAGDALIATGGTALLFFGKGLLAESFFRY